MNQEQKRNRTS